ncbi:MAG: site-specific integrase [Rhodoglobus sp.]|nr:site-specific integrase [Rhodoglobus sp.]
MVSRRANGGGSVWQRKDGRYSAALRMKLPDGTSRRKTFTVRTRAAADDLLHQKLSIVKRGIPAPATEWVVRDFLNYWLNDVVALKCRPRTVEVYETKIRIYINPAIGGKRLKDITVRDVQALLNQAVATGHLRAAGQVKQVLRAALNRAMREELLGRNVATLTELPQPRPKRITPWTSEEARRFLDGSKDHAWHIGYLLAALYGLRRGEVLGLRWCDIDLNADLIHVEQQAQRIDGQLIGGPVKTEHSRRSLALLPETRRALLAHLAKVLSQTGATLDELVLAGTPLLTMAQGGGYLDPKTFSNQFLKLSASLGLPRITIHALRHTAATNLKNVGVPARDVQLILGHAHVSTTQQLYQHADIQGQALALSLVERALLAAPTSVVSGQTWRSNAKIAERIGDFGAFQSGGTSGTRTHDTLLKSFIGSPYEWLPTPVRAQVRALVVPYLLGATAVKLGGQILLRTSTGSQPFGQSMLDLRSAA